MPGFPGIPAAGIGGCWPPREELTTIKIALLGTGFGQAHAAVYAERPDVGQVVVFGRTPQKLAKISGRLGFATAADPDAAITEASVDLVDICLPTPLHAEVAVRAMQAGHDVLIELPLAGTLDDARRIIAPSRPPAAGRSWTCSPGSARPASTCARRWPGIGSGRCGCWRSRAAPRCYGWDTTWAWTRWRWT